MNTSTSSPGRLPHSFREPVSPSAGCPRRRDGVLRSGAGAVATPAVVALGPATIGLGGADAFELRPALSAGQRDAA
jgi:hypothetical protein